MAIGTQLHAFAITIDQATDIHNFGNGFWWIVSSTAGTINLINDVDGTIHRSIPSPGGSNLGSIATDGGNRMWVLDITNNLIYVIEISTGTLMKSHSFVGGGSPNGIAYDGRSLWISNRITDLLYQLDAQDMTVIKTFALPSLTSRDVAWDGRDLWLSGGNADLVYQLDVDGTAIQSFSAPGSNTFGVGLDGAFIWVTTNTEVMFQLSLN